MQERIACSLLAAVLVGCGNGAVGADALPGDAPRAGLDTPVTTTADGAPSDAGQSPVADSGVVSGRYAGSHGSGVFAHVVAGSGDKERYRDLWEFWAKDTAVRGTQLSYKWVFLEPVQGAYEWSKVRAHIEPWARHGKKVWIEINSVGKRSMGDEGLPTWVRPLIPTVTSPDNTVYPIFWDAAYQKHWFQFIDAFAREFDGHPAIEFISTGGYAQSNEPRGYGDDTQVLEPQLVKFGYDGMGPSGTWFQKGFVPIATYYGGVFKRTRIAQVSVFSEPYSEALLDLCGRKLHYVFVSNGFSWKIASAASRTNWRERSLSYMTDIGYAEVGPSGIGALTLLELYQGAIGAGADTSRLSYLPLFHNLVVPGDQAAIDAVKWADQNLRNWKH